MVILTESESESQTDTESSKQLVIVIQHHVTNFTPEKNRYGTFLDNNV